MEKASKQTSKQARKKTLFKQISKQANILFQEKRWFRPDIDMTKMLIVTLNLKANKQTNKQTIKQ